MRTALPTLGGALVVAALLAVPARAQTPTPYPGGARTVPTPVGQGDAEHQAASADDGFMTHAAMDGQAEIELADLAMKQGQSAAVKTYASQIKADHLRAATELRRLASGKHVSLPTKPGDNAAATKERLSGLDGAAFDRAYAAEMVSAHQNAVNLFTTASQSADTEVKAFAAKTLPVLTMHLQHAQDLQKSLGGPTAQP